MFAGQFLDEAYADVDTAPNPNCERKQHPPVPAAIV